jgi:hypothetical protein
VKDSTSASYSVRSTIRHGVCGESENCHPPRRQVFHDGTGGVTFKGGPPLYNKRFCTDFNSYLATNSPRRWCRTSPASTNQPKRPNNIRFTAAIQRDLGPDRADAAYVGTRSKKAEN